MDSSLGHRVHSLGDGVGSLGDGVKASESTSIGTIGTIGVVGISGPLVIVTIGSIGSIRSIALGGGIKTLGDGVKTGGGSEGNSSSISKSNTISSIVGVSRPLAIVTIGSIGSIGGIALGRGIKALGDGVKTGRRSEGNSGSISKAISSIVRVSRPLGIGNSLGHGVSSLGDGVSSLGDGVQASGRSTNTIGVVGISGPLAIVPVGSIGSIRSIALGRGIKSLGDGVKTSGGTEGNSSSISKTISSIVRVSRPLAIIA